MRLLLVGDVMLGRGVNEVLKCMPADYPWGDTLRSFLLSDWRVCNLECVISDRGAPWQTTPKVFHFCSDAKNIAVLRAAKIDAVSLANNHLLDFGYDAMFETLDLLDRAGIRHAGAGADLEAASAAAVSEVMGKKIGLLAFTDNQPEWAAGSHQAGVWYVPIDVADRRAQLVFDRVQKMRSQVDIVLISAHWGPNWGYEPPEEHIVFAHRLADLGVDLVFGHSGHVFRGVEVYKNAAIMYCAGNFVDDYAVDPVERNDQSSIFLVDVISGRIKRLLLRSTMIRDCRAELAVGQDAFRIGSQMNRLCEAHGTAVRWYRDQGLLEIPVAFPDGKD